MRTPTLIAITLLALVTGCTEELIDTDGDMVEPEAKQVADDMAVPNILGTTSCAVGKVLVCHFPPGNPENAHAICIGAPAVETHVNAHGDTLGSCNASRVAVCQPWGAECSVDGDCCGGACAQNECIDHI